MSLLANLENSIQPEAPAPAPKEPVTEPEVEIDENPEADPDAEPEEDPEADPDAEPEEDPEADPDAEPEETTPALDPKAEFMVAGEKLTGAEIEKGFLRQADYTRKTQALADKAKELDAKEEESEDIKDWIRGLADPEDMRAELEANFPETFAALRDAILEEAIEEHGMSEREKTLYRANKANKDKDRLAAKAKAQSDKKTAKAEQAQKTNDLAKTFNTWTEECMAEVGLDPAKAEHVDLFRAKVATYRNQVWTKDTFTEAAKIVAKAVGAKPKPKPADKKADTKSKLPPVHQSGTKKPAAKPAPSRPVPPKDKSTGKFFSDLRKQMGLV